MAEKAQPAPHMFMHREVDPAPVRSRSARVYLRGWLQLALMVSPTIVIAAAITFLVLH